MKKLIFILCIGTIPGKFAFATGDTTSELSAQDMQSVLSQYNADIAELGCNSLTPISGTIGGGSTPMSTSTYITIQLAKTASTTETATLKIARIKSAMGASKLSIECKPIVR